MEEGILASEFLKKFPIKTIQLNGNAWEYILGGAENKKVVVIFPGGGQSAQSNFELIEKLSSEYKVIAITIYGVYSLDQFCKSVDLILKQEKVDELNLYGLSLGGILAQVYLRENPAKINRLILSHTCSAKSNRYKNRVILPVIFLKFMAPVIPDFLIRLIARSFAGKVQGLDVSKVKEFKMEENNKILGRYFAKEFYRKYFNKKLLKTWVELHLEFYNKHRNDKETFKQWRGKVLVFRTDNDPLMQDEGDFKEIFANISEITFSKTGHLSFYYRSDEIIKEIKKFLKS